MRKSKLESYENILGAIVNKPLTLDQLAYEIDVGCAILRQHLDFLMENSLVEERGSDNEIMYAITEKGVAVLRALNFEKYLGKIASKIRVIDEAMEALRRLEKTG